MTKNLRLLLWSAFLFTAFSCAPAEEPPPEDENEEREIPRADPYFPSFVPEGFTLEDYGQTQITAGESESLTFEAAAEDPQFFIAVDAEQEGVVVVVVSLIAPNGEEYILPETPRAEDLNDYFLQNPGPAISPNRAFARPRAVTAMVPNTPELAMQEGPWTFRVGAGIPEGDDEESFRLEPFEGTVRVGVVSRQANFIDEGAVDIVLSLHSSSGLTAESAPNDVGIQDALAQIDSLFIPVGITVGNVSYLDLNAELPDPIDLGGPSCAVGDIEKVFAAAEPITDAVNFIFVGNFTCSRLGGLIDVGANIGAVSNGVPGIPFATRDGIIVSTALKENFSEEWANVLAHELGHYLGLFHTVEAVPEVYDNIADTVEDESVAYLMHFRPGEGSPALTDEQGEILRSHPLVR